MEWFDTKEWGIGVTVNITVRSENTRRFGAITAETLTGETKKKEGLNKIQTKGRVKRKRKLPKLLLHHRHTHTHSPVFMGTFHFAALYFLCEKSLNLYLDGCRDNNSRF